MRQVDGRVRSRRRPPEEPGVAAERDQVDRAAGGLERARDRRVGRDDRVGRRGQATLPPGQEPRAHPDEGPHGHEVVLGPVDPVPRRDPAHRRCLHVRLELGPDRPARGPEGLTDLVGHDGSVHVGHAALAARRQTLGGQPDHAIGHLPHVPADPGSPQAVHPRPRDDRQRGIDVQHRGVGGERDSELAVGHPGLVPAVGGREHDDVLAGPDADERRRGHWCALTGTRGISSARE
ncbi:hypothetical protein NLS1_33390 [Nocardioides sp. LS1]|nr:hypothetical protein NLS1_33390 [Nocardioides sp. LS1]